MAITVNDKTYDAGRAEVRFGATAAAIQKIGFGDKLNTELVKRIGSQEIEAITEGEYETEDVSITVEQAIWLRVILAKLPDNGYGNFRFVITLFLQDPDLGQGSARLERTRIVGVKDNIEAGPGALVAELTCRTQQVVRNGKTLNRRKGVNTPSANNLIKL